MDFFLRIVSLWFICQAQVPKSCLWEPKQKAFVRFKTAGGNHSLKGLAVIGGDPWMAVLGRDGPSFCRLLDDDP